MLRGFWKRAGSLNLSSSSFEKEIIKERVIAGLARPGKRTSG